MGNEKSKNKDICPNVDQSKKNVDQLSDFLGRDKTNQTNQILKN